MSEPRPKGRAPASRVYASSPAPQQAHFPARRTSVRRTYGKKGTRNAALRQQTITQIDFLEPIHLEELDELEEAEERERERERAKKRRRRTDGDEGVRFGELGGIEKGDGRERKGRRKTDGAIPIEELSGAENGNGEAGRRTETGVDEDGDGNVPSSDFRTQTLTQFYGNRTIQDSEDEDEDGFALAEATRGTKSPSVIPQTPLKKRTTRLEIPSSQPSPGTPMLLRYSPLGPRASPLKARSTNVGSPLPTPREMRKKTPRGMVIQDSFASGVTLESGTSQASTGGLKERASSQILLSSGGRKQAGEPAVQGGSAGGLGSRKRLFERVEIPDSEDEDDDFDFGVGGDMTTITIPDSPTKRCGLALESTQASPRRSPRAKGREDQRDKSETEKEKDHGDEAETETGDEDDVENSYPVGPDTQFAMDFIASTEEKALKLSGARRSSRLATQATKPSPLSSSRPARRSPTPKTTPKRPAKKAAFVHFSSPQVSFEDEVRSSDQHRTQVYTQMGSQRVDFEVIRSMPMPTGRSDIFISIHPEHAKNIANGTKDHEFRTWKIPVTVCRIWIYVTKPESRLRYMACIGPAKVAGEISDERGLGNADFNRGDGKAKFAHEILELYELNNPVSFKKMKENGWLEVPPQKFMFVPPVVVSQLQSNLRCQLLRGPDEEDDEDGLGDQVPDSQVHDSQEVEAQLMSDIAYSTQRPSDIGSSQRMPRLSKNDASSRERSLRGQRVDGPHEEGEEGEAGRPEVIPSSQATTASDVSVQRPANPSSSMPVFHDSGSPVRVPEGDWGLRSSQLVGVSQLLPHSLLGECGPPADFDL